MDRRLKRARLLLLSRMIRKVIQRDREKLAQVVRAAIAEREGNGLPATAQTAKAEMARLRAALRILETRQAK